MKVATIRPFPLSPLLFDSTLSEDHQTDQIPEIMEKKTDGDDIFCAFCEKPVTQRRYKMQKDGQFEHVFTNPAGIVYRIGCFKQAPGCRLRGEETDYFTWFPGYAWSPAACESCLTHLGWRFTSQNRDRFFGLILAHLKGY
jgi:hypothetical protein